MKNLTDASAYISYGYENTEDESWHAGLLEVEDKVLHYGDDFNGSGNTLTFADLRKAGLEEIFIREDSRGHENYEDQELVFFEVLEEHVQELLQEAADKAQNEWEHLEIERRVEEILEPFSDEEISFWILHSPRGFANEVDLYAVRTEDEEQAKAWMEEQKNNPNCHIGTLKDREEVFQELKRGVKNRLTEGNQIENPSCGCSSIVSWEEAPWVTQAEDSGPSMD